jgi:hypothetical protein
MPPEISNREAIDMMNRCKAEIMSLRAIINQLRPKAEAYDSINAILRLLPQPSMGAGEDLIWTLDKRIRELTPPPPSKDEIGTEYRRHPEGKAALKTDGDV